ncbi:histidinol phosphatase [Clostridium tertium]|uniref:PHP domain protein n=1 Tax=Clostridium tertium TaxID=1559 RepID=A0A6N2ZZB7_9CLOT
MGRKKNKDVKIFDITNIKYYYGIPHSHTEFSTGKGSPIEAYEYAYKSGLNFLFITDHNSHLSKEVKIKDSNYDKFNAIKLYASKFKKKIDNFLPIVGFECKTSQFGDLNIINSNSYFTGSVRDLRALVLWMLNNEDSFICINHPHKNIVNLPYNPIFNKMITSVEVGNGNPSSKYTRHDKYYFNLLDAGWKLGAINGQDNHKINFGDSENLTVCLCNSLSTSHIISAFRERRTFSTESRYLKLYFTANNGFMGEEIFITSNKIRFMIYSEDIKYKIREIQIITNHGKIIKTIENIGLNSIKYFYEHNRSENESWYLIKIIEDDNKIAFSSPIFINTKITENKHGIQ